ncbi:anti-sigma regulatory factor (Ser/Thr protein kinase) [Saccharothrix coeruleofusca]|uniref:sensor histidine kinase n=1 Tax=Saccharothrix coeruleofusca TaxID=33919 RepID=UPI001AE5C42B|nr:sensor histidine kinase [Saccharothrix coeruleofusca]MBP2336718.1 anti-sigma regulatory factor (Ser/Thr protein kinase) [Saccharothrix coeruleofusca]
MTTAPAPHTGPFTHPALFYRGEDDYLGSVVPFITEGLARDEPVAVAVPAPRLAALRAALGPAAERVRWLDMTRVGRNPGRIIPGVLRAFADPHRGRRVRLVGEPIWPLRSAAEYPACAQHEALINYSFAGRDVAILCPYDVRGLSGQALRDAEMTHPVLIDGGVERASDHYAPEHVVRAYNRPLPPPPAHATPVDLSSPRPAARLRALATEHARELGFPPDRVDEVRLVVTELAANSVLHGGGTGTAWLWADRTHLFCQASDRGHITDPLAGRRPAPPEQPRGRGLLLVNHLADLVRTHTTPEGTTTRVRFAHR